jgi:hypothetical protein
MSQHCEGSCLTLSLCLSLFPFLPFSYSLPFSNKGHAINKPINHDNSCSQRTCWWNEICKEEFQTLFRCKCPLWSYCRSPGRYYNAFCTMTGTGYIWTQPDRSWGGSHIAEG